MLRVVQKGSSFILRTLYAVLYHKSERSKFSPEDLR